MASQLSPHYAYANAMCTCSRCGAKTTTATISDAKWHVIPAGFTVPAISQPLCYACDEELDAWMKRTMPA